MAQARMLRSFVTVGGWTMISRLLGFVRDVLIAAFLGSGPVAEAFLIAFSLPNMFRRFFAEGAMNMAFVPMFAKMVEAREDPLQFAREAFSGLAAVLIALTLVAQAVMPWLVLAMASGFAADERLDMATAFGRITFPYILLISLAALLSGILNSVGRFAAAAAAPVLLNVILIGTIWTVAATTGGMQAGARSLALGTALSWAVLAAGLAQAALLFVAARRAGYLMLPVRPRLTPRMRRLVKIAVPAMLAGGVVQINLLVGRQVASFFDGAIAWLNYADRLYQLPLGVIGIAIGVVLLPELSRRLRAGDAVAGRHSFNRAAEFALFLTIPAAAALAVLATPLVSVLFQRGRFDAADVSATALVLAIYGLGLPAFVLQKVLQPLYFAREDTRSPFAYALVGMAVNAALAVGLMPIAGFAAAAIATSLAAWVMVLLLLRGRRGMGPAARFEPLVLGRMLRMCLAAAVMAACLWTGAAVMGEYLVMPLVRYFALGGLVLIGTVAYFGTGQAIGAFDLAEMRRQMRR